MFTNMVQELAVFIGDLGFRCILCLSPVPVLDY